MDKQDIHLDDIKRLLFGEAPPIFLLEVFIRTLIMYTLLLICVRWMGKRMAGQLTILEMAVMIMLGAIVSVPMQSPKDGILQGALILVATAFLQRTIALAGVKRDSIERFVQGDITVLVKDGVIQIDQLQAARITHQQLFAHLRSNKIYNLSKVKRMYIEACGIFSIYKQEKDVPGLSVLPPQQHYHDTRQKRSDGYKACTYCGYTDKLNEPAQCPVCSHNAWVDAIE